jgi:hypothetical protein
MSYAEDIIKLRTRFAEAISSGVLEGSKETLEAMLIQIMNDAEKNRQNCVTQADNFRKQISTLDGQAAAFASVTSIIYNVLNGFIKLGERTKEEEERIKKEQEEALAEAAVITTEAPAEESQEAEEPAKAKKPGRTKKQSK